MVRRWALGGSSGTGLRRNLLLDGTAWVGVGITSGLLGSLLPASSRSAGMDPTGLAILAMLPFVASLSSVLSGRIGPRTPLGLMILRVAGSASLLLLLFDTRPVTIIVVVAIFWMTFMVGMPLQQRIWSIIYPARLRGRLLGIVGMGRFTAGALAILLAAHLGHEVGGLPVIALAGGFGAALALAAGRLDVPAADAPPGFSVRDAVGLAATRPGPRSVTVAHLVFGGALIAAAPLLTLLQVDRLGLTLTDIGTLGMVAAFATTGTTLLAGYAADARGTAPVMALGGMIGAAGMLVFATAEAMPGLLVGATLVGASVGSTELLLPLLIAERVGPREQATAVAGMSAVWGIRGLIVPLVVIWPVGLGIADVRGMLLACSAAMGLGALLYLGLADAEPVEFIRSNESVRAP